MKIILFLVFSICLISSIGSTNAQYMGNAESNKYIETAIRCPPGPLQTDAFIDADLVLTGTIGSILQTINDSTQYQVDVDQYLKGSNNEASLVFLAQGTNGQVERCNDIAFSSGDKVYLYLTKTNEGKWKTIPRSHVISKFCDNIQDPNSPILESIPKRDLVTSDFKRNHGGGYLEGSNIVYNFYALNTKTEKTHVSIAMNLTYGIDDANIKKVYEYSKEFDLKPCNGHRIIEWVFADPAIGKYYKKFIAEGSRDHISSGWFKVYPKSQYMELKPLDEDYDTISNTRNFDFVLSGIEYPIHGTDDSLSVQVYEDGLGCGTLHLQINSKSAQKLEHKSTDTCDTGTLEIQINSGNSSSINLSSGTYTVESWFDRMGDVVFSSEREFSLTTKNNIISPLDQYKNGVNFDLIECRKNLLLIQKYNDLPACVTSETRDKLIQRGWAKQSTEAVVIIPKNSGSPASQINLNPKEITVMLGTNNTVTWINKDDIPSTLVSDKIGWSTGLIEPGKQKSITFNKTGFFDYHGEPHPWKTGSVNVIAPPDMKTYKITADNTDYELLYHVVGAELYLVKKPSDTELAIQLNNPVEGNLILTVPRGLLDSKIGNVDDTFLIIGGDTQIHYTESRNAHSRTLSIQLEHWFDTIRIIGTDE